MGASANLVDVLQFFSVASRYPEEHIALLTNLGVSRQEAINALDIASGNPDLAASLLFQM
ncbi:hypothetical protein BX666DRAFT_1944259 [Dichotomocladium elegans]|nr:hypothetical protein BX666DRAFT_1944259 [Dichotomocladium elegans]